METTENTLKRFGQEQILRYWGELNESEKKSLEAQVRGTDWSVLENLAHPENLSGKGKIEPISGLRAKEIEARREEFFALGKEAIKKGKVGAVLHAGGQGTRPRARSISAYRVRWIYFSSRSKTYWKSRTSAARTCRCT